MRTVWIGMMAATFVLGTGIVAAMFVVTKIILYFTKNAS